MKPSLQLPTYLGGKGSAGTVHHLINQIPFHKTFVSGFLGHCTLTRTKLPAARTIGIDIDAKVVRRWRKLDIASLKLEVRNASFFENHIYLPVGNPQTFIYLDPPYLHETRRSSHRYDFELTKDQHIELLMTILKFPCMVAISHYENEMYESYLSGWRKIQFQSQTRGGTPATETLYMNYPAPAPYELHDPRFLGDGFRDREKAKRRIRTIMCKIERLTEAEKALLTYKLTSEHPQLATQISARTATLAETCEHR